MQAELTIKEVEVKPADARKFTLEMDFDVARYLALLVGRIEPKDEFQDADDALCSALEYFRYSLEDRYDYDLDDLIDNVR